MAYFLLGLLAFLGVHSVRIFAEDWRSRSIARWGENGYKLGYSVLSLAAFALMVWGFVLVRETPTLLWVPPIGMRHAASLLTLVGFILLAAAYVPRNSIRARLHHPVLLGVKSWALAHLLANGMLVHVVLFGGFLLWAALAFKKARARDRLQHTRYSAGTWPMTVLTVVLGTVAWVVFALWLHGLLIGIKPFGG